MTLQEMVESPLTGSRYIFSELLVEFMLYVSLGIRIFGRQLGLLKFTFLSGTLITFCGIICIVIIFIKKEYFPKSIYFAVAIIAIAMVSDLMVIDTGTFLSTGNRDLILWMSVLVMSCYVVRNDNACIRFSLFLGLSVLLSLYIGNTFTDVGSGSHLSRLTLRKGVVGSMFANANAIAQISYSSVAVLLFASLKCRTKCKIICWLSVIALSVVVLMTLSRQGLVLLSLSFLFYLSIALKGKGGTLGVVVFLTIVCVVAVISWDKVTLIKRGYEYRINLPSTRTEYFSTFFSDVQQTFFFGKGVANARTVSGMQPHNTFFWLHLAYGGICAWVYVFWVLWMMRRAWLLVWSKVVLLQSKSLALLVFSIFFLSQLTGVFAPANYGIILCIAIFEKYACYEPFMMRNSSTQDKQVSTIL